jgi:hypothetical protein
MDDKRDIDKIFTEGFSEEQFPYNPASWDAMSDMLDHDDKRQRRWLWLRWSLLLLVTIGAGIVYMTNRPMDSGEQEASVEVSTEAARLVTTDQDASTRAVNTDQDPAASISTDEDQNDQGQDSASEMVAGAAQSATTADDTQLLAQAAANGAEDGAEQVKATITDVDNTRGATQTRSIVDVATTMEQSTAVDKQDPAVVNRDQDQYATEDLAVVLDIGQLPLPIGAETTMTYDLDMPLYASTPDMVPVVRPRRWEVELTLGAELSVLDRQSDPKLGNRGGVRLGYYLSQRWSVHAGLIYSNKIFAGSGDAFQDRSIFTDAAPEKMEGKSAFVEIPVSVRYHWSANRRARQFVEVGFTNFNHRSEWYGFEYSPEDESPNLMREIPSRSVNKMALGAARIAYGIDIAFGGSTSLGVVPYVQVPLKGIGAGNVSIYNTGLELALRHRL